MNSISKKIINNYKLKLLNNVCTSRSDFHQLNKEYWKKAKTLNWIYSIIIFITILLSFIPLFFISSKDSEKILTSSWMVILNFFVLVVLAIDYFFWWITYPIRIKNNSSNPLLFFLFTCSSILMLFSIASAIMFALISIMPNYNLALVKTTKGLSILKISRLILLLNIIPSFRIFSEIFIRNRKIVFNLFSIILLIVFILALVIFSVEYDENPKINNYGDALYYSLITVSTVGFGDIVCVTTEGKIISVFLALMGAISLSIPFGIVIVSFNNKLKDKYDQNENIDVFATTTMLEIAYLKIFKKQFKNNENNQKAVVIIEGYRYSNENEITLIKLKDLLGGEQNIENINYNENDELEFHLLDKNKIKNNLNTLINILEIKVTLKNK